MKKNEVPDEVASALRSEEIPLKMKEQEDAMLARPNSLHQDLRGMGFLEYVFNIVPHFWNPHLLGLEVASALRSEEIPLKMKEQEDAMLARPNLLHRDLRGMGFPEYMFNIVPHFWNPHLHGLEVPSALRSEEISLKMKEQEDAMLARPYLLQQDLRGMGFPEYMFNIVPHFWVPRLHGLELTDSECNNLTADGQLLDLQEISRMLSDRLGAFGVPANISLLIERIISYCSSTPADQMNSQDVGRLFTDLEKENQGSGPNTRIPLARDVENQIIDVQPPLEAHGLIQEPLKILIYIAEAIGIGNRGLSRATRLLMTLVEVFNGLESVSSLAATIIGQSRWESARARVVGQFFTELGCAFTGCSFLAAFSSLLLPHPYNLWLNCLSPIMPAIAIIRNLKR